MANKNKSNNTAAPAPAQTEQAAPTRQRVTPKNEHGDHSQLSLSLFDRLVILWLTLSGWIQVVLGGIFVVHHATIAKAAGLPNSHTDFLNLFNKAVGKEGPFEALGHAFVGVAQSLHKAYSCADSRFAGSDSTVLALETARSYFIGPLCFFLAYAVAYKRGWRHSLQLVVSSLQLAAVGFYFLTEHFNNYSHVNQKSAKCYYVYFWGGNLFFASAFFLLFLQSFFTTQVQVAKAPKGRRVNFAVKTLVGATLVGLAFVVAVGLAHEFLERPHVQKEIVNAVQTAQTYSKVVQVEAQKAAQEGYKQAQTLLAPYFEQAAQFVKQNLAKVQL